MVVSLQEKKASNLRKLAVSPGFQNLKPSEQEDAMMKALDMTEREHGGARVVNPGFDSDFSTGSSAMAKGYGARAFDPSGSTTQSFWQRWDDPGQRMNPAIRQAMLSKSLRDVGYEEKGHWGSFGEFLKEGYLHHRDGDFHKKHRSSYEKVDNAFFKARGLTTISGEAGGFLVNPEIAPTVEWLFNTSDLPGRINTLPIQSMYYEWPRAKDLDRNNGSRHGGIFSRWIDEGSDGTESKPSFVKESMKMKKLAVFVPVTHELIASSPYAIEQQIREAVRAEINFSLAHGIVWGTGTNDPLGFANTNHTAMVTAPKTSGQSARTFTTANALAMLARLYRTSSTQAIWLHHQSAIEQIGQLAISNTPIAVNHLEGGVANQLIQSLYARPLIESELCSPLGDKNDVMLIDPKAYVAITQSTIRDDVSMEVNFMSDQQMMRFIIYFDGRPLYTKPVTPFKPAAATQTPATQSSFVNLDARTS